MLVSLVPVISSDLKESSPSSRDYADDLVKSESDPLTVNNSNSAGTANAEDRTSPPSDGSSLNQQQYAMQHGRYSSSLTAGSGSEQAIQSSPGSGEYQAAASYGQTGSSAHYGSQHGGGASYYGSNGGGTGSNGMYLNPLQASLFYPHLYSSVNPTSLNLHNNGTSSSQHHHHHHQQQQQHLGSSDHHHVSTHQGMDDYVVPDPNEINNQTPREETYLDPGNEGQTGPIRYGSGRSEHGVWRPY